MTTRTVSREEFVQRYWNQRRAKRKKAHLDYIACRKAAIDRVRRRKHK